METLSRKWHAPGDACQVGQPNAFGQGGPGEGRSPTESSVLLGTACHSLASTHERGRPRLPAKCIGKVGPAHFFAHFALDTTRRPPGIIESPASQALNRARA